MGRRSREAKNIAETIATAAQDAAEEFVPAIAEKALRNAADETDDPAMSLILGVLADTVEKNGRDGILLVGDQIRRVIAGKAPVGILEDHMSAEELTLLVDALQGAEAAHRKKQAKAVLGIMGFVELLGKLIVAEGAKRLFAGLG